MTDLHLSLKRIGHAYNCTLDLCADGGLAPQHLFNVSWGQVLDAVVTHMHQCSAERVVMVRAELPCKEVVLSKSDVDALRSVSYEPSPSTTSSRPAVSAPVKMVIPPLRAGHDVLADAFGEYVYLTRRPDGSVENPFTGRWDGEPGVLRAPGGWTSLATYYTTPNWAVVLTDALLYVGNKNSSARYWIPRAWNPAGWVTHESLAAKYAEFRKEVEECKIQYEQHHDRWA